MPHGARAGRGRPDARSRRRSAPPPGFECIRAIKGEVEGCNVGAGTVLDARQVDDAVGAGAHFSGEPRCAAEAACRSRAGCPVPFLPGVATAGEAMALAEEGFALVKFFRPSRRWHRLSRRWRAAARHPLPPDRRGRREECGGVSSAPQRDSRRRQLAAPADALASGELDQDHCAVAGSRATRAGSERVRSGTH